MKFLSFFILVLSGFALVQTFAHRQDITSPASRYLHASIGRDIFSNDNSSAEFQIDNPVSSPLQRDFIEISNVREVEEDDQFCVDSFHAQLVDYFSGSPEKSLPYFKPLTSLSSRRHLMLRVIRI